MNARHLLAARAFCAAASFLTACASSDPDLGKTAADPSQIGPAPSAGSGVLRPGFDPSSLGPAAPMGGGHEHQHHDHGSHAAPEAPAATPSAPTPPARAPSVPK